MRILSVQYNYTNRYKNDGYVNTNSQMVSVSSPQIEKQASVNFQGLLYFLTKDKRLDVIGTKNAGELIENSLSELNIYSDNEIAKAKDMILYVTRKNRFKHYRTVIQKILELAKEKITIQNVLQFKDVNFTPYEFENLANKILKVSKLGYPIDYMPILFDKKIENVGDIKRLIDIRDEGLKRKELLSYPFWKVEDDDVNDLLLGEPGNTLNMLKLFGKKSFISSFEDKYDNVENNILNIGEIDEKYSMYEDLLMLTNPAESKLYKELESEIKTLKSVYVEYSDNADLRDAINTYTKLSREIVSNAIKKTQDKILAGHIFYMLSESPNQLRHIFPTLNDNSMAGQRKRNKIMNTYLLTSNDGVLEKRLDFRHSKFLTNMITADAEFTNNFTKFINKITKSPKVPIPVLLDSYPMNIDTKKQFKRLGIDYEKWVTFNPKSKIEKTVVINNSNLRNNVIKNLNADFNNVLFKSIPQEEFDKLKNILARNGYMLLNESSAEYSAEGFFNGMKQGYGLYKENHPIEFEDALKIINIIKNIMKNSEFWNGQSSDVQVEQAKKAIKYQFLYSRKNEIQNANLNQKSEVAKIKVQKADMSDIEHSLFLGNYANCCTSVGKGVNQSVATSYLACKLVSAIEVLDDKEYVGNTMCFIAKINNKPALILDNIELQHKYQYDKQIRDMIFEYARKLATEIGQPDMPIYAFPNKHKVDMDDLKMVQEDFSIVGNSGDWQIYLDFDTDLHQIREDVDYNSYLYKIS